MSNECIHGFEEGLCAQCFPKAIPDAAKTPEAKPRASRASSSSARSAKRRIPGAGAKSSFAAQPLEDVGEQRIYHVTHIDNLASILSSGSVLAIDPLGHAADVADAQDKRPTVDISSSSARESRRGTTVPGQESTVSNYVPFFLAPDARVWDSIRSQEADPRLADNVRGLAASEFVILVGAVKTVLAAETDGSQSALTVTDMDATGPLTRFGTGREDAERMLRKLRAEGEAHSILEAEFLVKDAFSFEHVNIIGVIGEKVRNTVKNMLAESDYSTKVVVHPPWFKRPEES